MVALHHLVEPPLAHRESVVDVVIARVVAPGEMERVVARREDAGGGARSVDLLEGDHVRVEATGVAGKGPVVRVASGDRAAPQRTAGSPVQQVEVPARDPDPFGRCGRRSVRRPTLRWQALRASRRSRGTGTGFDAGLLFVPDFASTVIVVARAPGSTHTRPVAMTRAARPVVVATIFRESTGVCRSNRRDQQCTRHETSKNQNLQETPPLHGSHHAVRAIAAGLHPGAHVGMYGTVDPAAWCTAPSTPSSRS